MSSPEPDTKAHILTTGLRLTARRGYTGVGLSELLKVAGVPKGSFYHYFPSKEAYGCALLESYIAAYRVRLNHALQHPERNGRERLLAFFEGWMNKQGCGKPEERCLVVKLSAEVADLSDDMSQILARAITGIEQSLSTTLREGIDDGSVVIECDPEQLGATLYHLWLGASLVASVAHQDRPLKAAFEFTQGIIKAP